MQHIPSISLGFFVADLLSTLIMYLPDFLPW